MRTAHNFVDLSGRRYGRLVVLCRSDKRAVHVQWDCRCDCGAAHTVSASNLRSGSIVSCGCLKRERITQASTTHGLSGIPEHTVWHGMKQRCLCPANESYVRYGGRGITVCDQWLNNFAQFYADMGPRPSARHTIERRDNDGPYSPDNCYWATRKEQAANRRRPTRRKA